MSQGDLFAARRLRTARAAPAQPDTRPVLVGMNNPISRHPSHALYPSPVNCTGWRVWQLLQGADPSISDEQYLLGFDRRNVLSARTWSAREARAAGAELMDEISGRTIVVLGVETCRALGLPRSPWAEWASHGATRCVLLPHPSGRCREYNEPSMRARAGAVLLEAYRGRRGALAGGGEPG